MLEFDMMLEFSRFSFVEEGDLPKTGDVMWLRVYSV